MAYLVGCVLFGFPWHCKLPEGMLWRKWYACGRSNWTCHLKMILAVYLWLHCGDCCGYTFGLMAVGWVILTWPNFVHKRNPGLQSWRWIIFRQPQRKKKRMRQMVTNGEIVPSYSHEPMQSWPFTSYNWWFQWDYTFYKWGDLLVLITDFYGHNWQI